MYFFSTSNKKSKYIYCYFVSSKIFKSDIQIGDLAPFFKQKLEYKIGNIALIKNNQSSYSSIYKGPGSIGDSLREISLYKYKNNFELMIQDVGKFLIINDSRGIKIFLTDTNLNINNNLLIESLLGPIIILCFALDGIFCFHASAFEYENKAILFMGKSGSGKSTLVEFLSNNSNGLITRIADDIVPLSIINNKLYALPHFPQLKLKAKEQYPVGKRPRLRISTIYILNSDNRRNSVKIEEHQSGEKISSLISNTVASLLFDRELNREHLNFCSYITQNIELKKLTFPHNRKSLDDILNTIHLA